MFADDRVLLRTNVEADVLAADARNCAFQHMQTIDIAGICQKGRRESPRLVSIALIPSVDHRRKLRVFFENVSIENPRDLLRVFLEHWSS